MFKKMVSRWWFWPLIAGVILRVALMPATYHQDLLGHSAAGYFFAYEGVTNIYDHLLSLPPDHPLVKNVGIGDIFIYPPLAYYTLGVFRLIVKPFADPGFVPWLWNSPSSVNLFPNFGWQLILFKLPYLFIDVAAGFLLAGIFDDVRKKKIAFTIWMFNFVTLYATFMVGQLDILPVFFTILSCFLIKKKKFGWALFSLGIGAAYKTYPLLLIPPAAFVLGKTFWGKAKLTVIGLIPYLIAIGPFLNSKGFRAMVLFGPKETKMLFMSWPVTAAEGIFPFILVLTAIYLAAYYLRNKLTVEYYFLALLLLIFSVTHYHPQWFLWVTPFLIWALVEKNIKHTLIISILFVSWLIITLFFEPSLTWGLFAPVFPALSSAPGLTEILSRYIEVAQIKSVIRSIFAGASLIYCYLLASGSRHET